MAELDDFNLGYIVLLIYETQDIVDIKAKESIGEFMLNYLLLQDLDLSKMANVIEKNSFINQRGTISTNKSSLTFLSIFINLYHYCGEKNDSAYFGNSNFLCSMLPVINIFVEKILYSDSGDSK